MSCNELGLDHLILFRAHLCFKRHFILMVSKFCCWVRPLLNAWKVVFLQIYLGCAWSYRIIGGTNTHRCQCISVCLINLKLIDLVVYTWVGKISFKLIWIATVRLLLWMLDICWRWSIWFSKLIFNWSQLILIFW